MPTEVYRPRRSEYPRPTNPVEAHRRDNADRYITSYTQRLSAPLCLLNHVGVIPFTSEKPILEERESALAEYFFMQPPYPGQWSWGRTLLAEDVSLQLVQATLAHQLNASYAYVETVPTEIDASSKHGEVPYKKGVDLCMVQMQQREGANVLAPLCGIDVTLGDSNVVRDKRQRPGLQSAIAMPAIVVPLTHLVYEGKKSHGFARYLDKVVREEILEKGVYTPFYQLSERDVAAWKNTIRSELRLAIAKCRERLTVSATPRLAEYPYLKDVIDKLNKTATLVDGFPIPSDSA